MKLEIDDVQANWILNGLKLLIAANIERAGFDEIVKISQFGMQFEMSLNAQVRGNIPQTEEDIRKTRFTLGKGPTAQDFPKH